MADSPGAVPLIRGEGLEWWAGGRRIVGPLSVDVAEGECLSVIGPNGAGKTSLLRLLVGIHRPARGQLWWRGKRIDALERRELARRIAYVPQITPQRIPLSVEQLVGQGRYPHLGRFQLAPTAEDFAAMHRAMELAGVEGLEARRVDELSGGERQAVYIAAALAQEGQLLILDEPTAHLDAKHQREVAALLSRLVGEGHRTVLVATHDLNFASRVSTRLLALEQGVEVASGLPDEVLRPELLERLFAAPFEVVREGERPITVVSYEA